MIINNRKNIKNIQIIFFASIVVLICMFVLALPRISIPLFLAYILSLALGPIVNMLMSWGIKKSTSIILIFLLLAILIGLPLVKIIPMLSEESQSFQYTIPKIETYAIERFEEMRAFVFQKTGHEISDVYALQILNEIKDKGSQVVVKLPNYLANLLEWIFLVPFFSFFIMRDSEQFKKMFLSFTPNSIFERFYYVTHMFNRQLGNYFFAKFVEAFIVGGIITIGLLIMGIEYATILGIIAGLTNIVPYVGPFLGAIPAISIAIVEYGFQSQQVGGIALLYLVANIVDIFFVFPFLVSKIVNLHPMIVAVSVIVGSHYMGITGMVISIPMVAAIKLIITEIYNEIYTERSR